MSSSNLLNPPEEYQWTNKPDEAGPVAKIKKKNIDTDQNVVSNFYNMPWTNPEVNGAPNRVTTSSNLLPWRFPNLEMASLPALDVFNTPVAPPETIGESSEAQDSDLCLMTSSESETAQRRSIECISPETLKNEKEHIKRLPNAYIIFFKEKHAEIQSQGNLYMREVSCQAGKIWKEMSSEEKEVYYGKAQKAKEDHEKMYPDYRYPSRCYKTKKRAFDSRWSEKFLNLEANSLDGVTVAPMWCAPNSEVAPWAAGMTEAAKESLQDFYNMQWAPPETFVALSGAQSSSSRPSESEAAQRSPECISPETLKNEKEHIKRPPNAYIIFFKEKHAEIQSQGNLYMREVSCQAGKIWKEMSSEEKEVYYEKAEKAKEEHAKMYPDYRFKPCALDWPQLRKRVNSEANPSDDVTVAQTWCPPEVSTSSIPLKKNQESIRRELGRSKLFLFPKQLYQSSLTFPIPLYDLFFSYSKLIFLICSSICSRKSWNVI